MTPDEQKEERLRGFERGEALEVDPTRIEAELNGLWRQAAHDLQTRGTRAVMRACLWNLIVRVADASEDAIRHAKQLVDDLSESVPTRAIVLRAEPAGGGDTLQAWVEANWRCNAGNTLTGSDEVTLAARGRGVERLPSLVRALLVPDAPTALLWLGPPPDHTASHDPLLPEVDRLLCDTRRLVAEEHLAELEQVLKQLPTLEVVDLAWVGVRPLRGLLAALFDPPACDPRELLTLDRVEVAAGVYGTQARALLTLGWLGARLGWHDYRDAKAKQAGQRCWTAKRPDGGTVELALSTRQGVVHHGVVACTLERGDRRWCLERHGPAFEIAAPCLPPRAQPVRTHADPDLILTGLGARGRDPLYRATLAETVRLVAAQPGGHG